MLAGQRLGGPDFQFSGTIVGVEGEGFLVEFGVFAFHINGNLFSCGHIMWFVASCFAAGCDMVPAFTGCRYCAWY